MKKFDKTNTSNDEIVADYIIGDRWDLFRLNIILPTDVVSCIRNIPISTVVDNFVWAATLDGRFTTKFTYNLILKENQGGPNNNWQAVWQIKTLPRIKMFAWLAKHKKHLTNLERYHRGFSDNPFCPHCHGLEESMLHVLRDCIKARAIWEKVVPIQHQTLFFSQDYKDWFDSNLLRKAKAENTALTWN